MRVLRDAQRAGNRAGMTEADILLVMANTITSRGNITEDKKKVPGYLNVLRSQLDLNKCGMFEKAGCLSPDCKPKQQLWKLVRNAQTENIPDVEKSTYVSYDDIDLERYQISEASAKYISLSEDDPVAKTRGEKRARGGDDDAGDARRTGRARLETSEGGAGDDAKEAAAQEAAARAAAVGAAKAAEAAKAKEAAAQEAAAQEAAAAEAAKAKKAAAKEAAAKEAAAKEAAAREAAAQEAAAQEAAAQEAAAQEAAARAAAVESAKAKEAAAREAAAAASRKRTAESLEEERRLKVAKEAKDARVREAQEKLRTLRREKDERHPRAGAVGGSGPIKVGGSSAASVAAFGAASGSSEALEARRLWEADAAWWSKHGPKAVDPDSGKRRLFTKTSPESRWHFTEVQTSFPNGFVYVAEDRVVDEARRRGVLGMPADAAHLLARKINKDTAIFLCRVSVSSERDIRDKTDRMPRLDLDVYGASEPYPRAEKGAPPVAADASFFGGRLPAQIKIHKRRCFGVALRGDLGSAAVSGGLVDLRGVSFKTEQKLKRAENLMPVLLKNAKRTDALVAELRARAREAVRAKRGLP